MSNEERHDVTIRSVGERKRIALIAHDNRKMDLLEWARFNRDMLAEHELYATGTTGSILAAELDLDIERFESGPLGGDLQIGARISEGLLDMIVFFWDPLQTQPHDVDVKALLRIAVVYNIPAACNRTTANFLISSPLFSEPYDAELIDYRQRIHPDVARAAGKSST
jgi:methylglyoxal synthase